MKTSLFDIIRKQKKLVNSFIFLISWSQIHAQANHLFLNKEDRQPETKEYKSTASKSSGPVFSTDEENLSDSSESSPVVLERTEKAEPQPEVLSKSSRTFEGTTLPTYNTNSSRYYISDIKQGVIGKDEAHPIDQVYDNIFTVIVDNAVKSNSSAWLEYELYGVAHSSGVSKYINDELATGGNVVEKNNQWTSHSEALSTSAILQGKNKITFTIPSGAEYAYKVRNVRIRIDKSTPSSYKPEKTASSVLIKNIAAGEEGVLNWEGAGLEVDKGSLKTSKNFSVTPLRDIDIPATTPEFVNVTQQHFAYRFLPHGEHFSIPAKVTMAYDKSKIPAGYTEQDIRAFYFDDTQKKWMALEKDSLMAEKQILVSKTTHFTDMIAGIIKVPESPETGNYAPNSIKDIKAADPSAGIVSIGAPSPNSMGTVNTSFPIKLPSGRQGMQPSLSVNYNSEGGNGWMGLGWDLSIPAISIDTRWGVPEYNPGKETEIYSFGGEQLTFKELDKYVLPNRTEGFNKDRTENRQFYPRIEGAYNKIIRHGGSPSDYWWEVISKDGTRNYFGGDKTGVNPSYVLKDKNGNIGHWALYRTVDLNDNYVEYTYDNTPYSGNPGNGAQEMVISKIQYTLHTAQNPPRNYNVKFITESGRKDVQLNARLGFVQATSKKLSKVEITYGDELVRSYDFKYKEGAFYKTLLESITEKGADGKEFYTNRIEYYNNIGNEKNIFTAKKTVNIPSPIDKATSLSNNVASNNSFGLAVTVGIIPTGSTDAIFTLKNATLGPNYQYSTGKSFGQTQMVDINGDGLADNVYTQKGNTLFNYLKNNSLGSSISFNGGQNNIQNSSPFSINKSVTNSFGLEFTAGTVISANINYSASTEKTITKNYMEDVNSDGIMDLIEDGKVKFGYVDGGVVKYSDNSAITPNPITSDKYMVTPDPAEEKETRSQSPLMDIVKIWKAPYAGVIKITGNASLDQGSKDGVKVMVQHSGTELQRSDLAPGNSMPISITNRTVQKGEYLYFRISSVDNGAKDLANLDAKIDYTQLITSGGNVTINTPYDENFESYYSFDVKKDYLLTSKTSFSAPFASAMTITGNFVKQQTSDAVSLYITKIASGSNTPSDIYVKTLDASAQNFALNFTENANDGDVYSISLRSESEINWTLVDVNGIKASFSGTINGQQASTDLYPMVDKQFYNWKEDVYEIPAAPYMGGTVAKVVPYIAFNNVSPSRPFPGNIKVSIKRYAQNGTLLVTDNSTVALNGYTDGIYTGWNGQAIIPTTLSPDNTYYTFVSYYLENAEQLKYISEVGHWTRGERFTDYPRERANLYAPDTDRILKQDPNDSSKQIIDQEDDGRFGPMYKNWGQFSYNGGWGNYNDPDNPHWDNQPIAENVLTIDTSDAANTDPTTSTAVPVYKQRWFQLIAYGGKDPEDQEEGDIVYRYQGSKPNIFVEKNKLSASRLGDDDVKEMLGIPDLSGSGHFAPLKVSKNNSSNFSGGISTPVSGFGGSLGEGQIKNISNYIDLNGDGYPDVLSSNQVQYTHMMGGYSEHTPGNISVEGAMYISQDTSNTEGFSAGSSTPIPFKSDSPSKTALRMSQAGFNLGAGENKNKDYSDYDFADINGDGLPDRVFRDGKVALNLGYSFAPAEAWNYGQDFRRGESVSSSVSAGASLGAVVGKVIANASIAFGYNGSDTNSKQEEQLIDINGDGLVDKIESGRVKLNTGNGFIDYTDISFINTTNSQGKSLNFAVSVCPSIPLGPTGTSIKLCINPSYNTGSSYTNTRQQIQDINGDGFPDLLVGDTDKNVDYNLSQIGTTNLIKKVTLPMGGNWEVTYDRAGNTYDLPQNKWIMTSVVMNDGFTGDSQFKPDVSKITITYENPYHSRRERTFYGFSNVTINQIDTKQGGAASNVVYRKTVQLFYNSNYYLKGALDIETLLDADTKPWTRKSNEYSLRRIQDINSTDTPLEKEDEKTADNYAYFVSKDIVKSSFHEGQLNVQKSTSTFLTYDQWGNVIKTLDFGDLEIGASEVLTSDVAYQITDTPTDYLILPTGVKSTASGVVRERKAQYDSKGNVTDITMVGPGNPVSSYQYDVYGNIKKATGPANYQGQRFFHEYTYDSNVMTYPTMVKDAFGYSSKSEYDFRFGVPVFTEDMNLQPTQYAYDAAGRTTEITGPYEMFNDIPWTIQFEYRPITDAPLNATGAQSYAITRHYDPDNANNTINTVSISDGLGSTIQVKKTADLYQKGLKYVVSGKVEQDAFGRALKTYYPTESQASVNTYDATVDNIVPTINTYDVLDRVLTTKLPDEDLISEMEYGFGNDREGRPMFRTTITDELGTIKKAYTDIKGRTTTVHEPSNTGDIFTSFTHDAIGELLKVRDVQNNLTTSIYDDLGRRTSMTHPDSGTSTFVYDPASNMTSRTNAENETATYEYDYKRLKAINYPKYPENNVKYYYGQAMDASAMDNNSVGRLWYQTDATGTQYLKYGRLGELTHQRRSVAAPGAGVYWFGTDWEYDTWNRVKTITYPDGEKVTYNYNLAGNLKTMTSTKDGFTRNMISELGYDKFDQRVFLKYGNGTTTSYEYETKRRRLLKMNAQTPGNRYFMKNLYQYDVVSNVLQIHNNAPVAQAGLLGGGTNHAYGYDDLYRLTSASGNWRGMNPQGQEERQRYTVTMAYDNMHNVMSKTQKHERAMGNTGNVWNNMEATSYRLNYRYESTKPHAPTTVVDEPNVPGALCCDVNNPQVKFQNYTYDKKGNPTAIAQQTCNATEPKTKYLWDEENRMRFVDTNPSTPEVDGSAIYTYDAGGERIIKNVLSTAVITGSNGTSQTISKNDYSLYPNGMAVARLIFNTQTQKYELSYTKHYYVESQRINSKLGKGKDVGLFNCAWLIIPYGAGASSINEKVVAKEKLDANTAASLAIMAANGITPPPNYGQNAGYTENCVPSYTGVEEKDTYWYHPDHLGSSSFITGLDGEVTQNIEYFPSGEVFVENHKNSYNTPYKFNGKEQDDETGYYYYGARYYNPRMSLWLNVDPLADYNPFMNDQAYIDGEHNGGIYNSGNNNPYIYCYQNPILYIDPNGKQSMAGALRGVPDGEKDNVIAGWRESLRKGGYQMDFVPLFGDAKGVVEGIAGTDMQGNRLSGFDRILSVFLLTELRDTRAGARVLTELNKTRKITKPLWGAKIADYGTTAMEHIADGHFFRSRAGQESSRFLQAFSNPKSVKELVQEAITKGTHSGSKGNYKVVYEFDEVIGTYDTSVKRIVKGEEKKIISSHKTKKITIYLDDTGNVKNAYPTK